MFTNCQTTIAVTDLKRAKEFYGKKLGLKDNGPRMPEHDWTYECAGHEIYLYERPEPAGSTATVCSLETENVEKTVKDLRGRGVTFEEYDIPEMDLKTVNGIATLGPIKAAWFKDPDGNILSVANPRAGSAKTRQVETQAR